MENLNISKLFEGSPSPFEPVDFNNLELKVDEELIIASEKERVSNEMVEFLTSLIMTKYNCSKEDVYKFWDEYKEMLQSYLQEQLTKDDCLKEIKRVLLTVSEDSPRCVKVGIVIKALKGKADNSLIKECIDELF